MLKKFFKACWKFYAVKLWKDTFYITSTLGKVKFQFISTTTATTTTSKATAESKLEKSYSSKCITAIIITSGGYS